MYHNERHYTFKFCRDFYWILCDLCYIDESLRMLSLLLTNKVVLPYKVKVQWLPKSLDAYPCHLLS